jgi:hypothetical protein
MVARFEMVSNATDAARCHEIIDRGGERCLNPRAVAPPAEDPSGALLEF